MLLQEHGGENDEYSKYYRTAPDPEVFPEFGTIQDSTAASNGVKYMDAGKHVGGCVMAVYVMYQVSKQIRFSQGFRP